MMRMWDLRARVRRAGRVISNLFRSREAIEQDELKQMQSALEILLSAHGHVLTEEERARFAELLEPEQQRAYRDQVRSRAAVDDDHASDR